MPCADPKDPWDLEKRRAAMLSMDGLVHLGAKYELPRLQKSLKKSIGSYWPTTLEQWDNWEESVWADHKGVTSSHPSAGH